MAKLRSSLQWFNHIQTTMWIITVLVVPDITGEIIFRVDPLALLSATLRTYQRAGCDTDQVSLTCPRGTSISIELAQYGRTGGNDGLTIEELCPSTNANDVENILTTHRATSSNLNGNSINDNNSTSNTSNNTKTSDGNTSENCMWPNALQYSLLQTVVEACQKKKHCKFNASPGTYGGGSSGVGDSTGSSSFHSASSASIDPCPRVRKFVEIAYKCRPYEFRSKVACANDVVQLECNPYSRIAIYSSSFGRTEYESIQCPQPQGVKEETCLASYATETVMQICHGRRRCSLSADSTTFGTPCSPNSRMYLKVVYTCVPKQVLKDRYEVTPEPDEPEHFDGDANELYDEDQFYKESEAIPKLQSNLTRIASIKNATTTMEPSTSSNPLMTQSKDVNLEDDQERLYFYLLIAGTIGVILCIIIVIGRVIIQKRREPNDISSSSPKGETSLPSGFNDSISEIDDIDLTTSVPVPSVSKNENYIQYGPSSSLYGSLGPSNVSHTSTTMLLPTNSLMCARQSPDIIGVGVPNTFTGQPSHVSSVGTIVPISSLAQYTTAPTYHTGYIMDHEGILRRPISSQPHQLAQQQPPSQSETFHYDGTAPRTLSTGVAHNSQFYYG